MKKVLLILPLLTVLACSGKKDAEASPAVVEQVLIFARSGDAVGLDPAKETDGESYAVTAQIFEGLVGFGDGSLQIVPRLAERWDVGADGLNYTFYLRRGVKFHDGSPFNADAVLFSYDRQRDPDHPAYSQGPWSYWQSMGMSEIIDQVKKIDDYTVEITLQRPEAAILADLAMDFAGIVSPTAAEKWGEQAGDHPSGTGPFRFLSWQRGDRIVLERNPDYWGEPAKLDRLILRAIPDQSARWVALQKGEADIIDLPAPSDVPTIKADQRFKIVSAVGLNVGYIAFNTKKPPFDDVRVRQALNYAVDREALVKAIFGDFGVPAKNPLPPQMWAYNNDIELYPYAPERAKQLLAEAGYPNGLSTDLWAVPVTRPYMPNGRRTAEILQEQFRKVGVESQIVSYDWGSYLDRTMTGEHQLGMLGWNGDNGDPDNFLRTLLSIQAATPPAANIAFWENEEFDRLVNQAAVTAEQEKRAELYRQAQVIFREQAPWILLAHGVVNVPMRKEVQGYKIQPSSGQYFANVSLGGS